MGFGHWLGDLVHRPGRALGTAMKIAAPAAALIPGVGTAAAIGLGAAGGALGRTLQGKANIGQILKSGLAGGAGAGAGKILGGALGDPGNAGLAAGRGAGTAGSLGSRVGNALGSVGSSALKNPLAYGQAATAVLGARQSGQENELARDRATQQDTLQREQMTQQGSQFDRELAQRQQQQTFEQQQIEEKKRQDAEKAKMIFPILMQLLQRAQGGGQGAGMQGLSPELMQQLLGSMGAR